MKLIKIVGYWIIVSDEKYSENTWVLGITPKTSQYKFANDGKIIYNKLPEPFADQEAFRKIIASQNPEHNLPSITFSNEVAKELGIFEYMDFWENMPVRWVKWTKRQPDWNGSVYLQFNGKNQGLGRVFHKQLLSLDGHDTKYHVEDGKIIADYSDQQLEMLDTVYWLEQDFNYQSMLDNKDKLFTLEEAAKIFEAGWQCRNNCGYKINDTYKEDYDKCIQSLTKQEYEVELEIEYQNQDNKWSLYYPFASSAKTERPRITNNSVKVIKIIK